MIQGGRSPLQVGKEPLCVSTELGSEITPLRAPGPPARTCLSAKMLTRLLLQNCLMGVPTMQEEGWEVACFRGRKPGLASSRTHKGLQPAGLLLSLCSALVALGAYWGLGPHTKAESDGCCSSELVYALMSLSSSQRTGPLPPPPLVPPSRSGENKWTIHVQKSQKGGGDATDRLH